MAKPDEEKMETEIIDETDIPTYRGLEKFVTRAITYRYRDMIIGTVFIPVKEDTPEERAKLIREDIEKKMAFKPKKIRV